MMCKKIEILVNVFSLYGVNKFNSHGINKFYRRGVVVGVLYTISEIEILKIVYYISGKIEVTFQNTYAIEI